MPAFEEIHAHLEIEEVVALPLKASLAPGPKVGLQHQGNEIEM